MFRTATPSLTQVLEAGKQKQNRASFFISQERVAFAQSRVLGADACRSSFFIPSHWNFPPNKGSPVLICVAAYALQSVMCLAAVLD